MIIAGGVVIEGGVARPVNPFGGRTREAATAAGIQAAIDEAAEGDVIYIRPGTYDVELSIPYTKPNITLVGIGGRGAVAIAPSGSNKTALTNHATDITLINVGLEGDGTKGGLLNTGKRFRAYACKIEGGTDAVTMTLGTVAEIAALSKGKGDDCWLVDCEICWSTNGVRITASDYGAVTQVRFRNCTFHDNSAADFEESGGSVGIRFRDLDIDGCKFRRQEDGSEPTKYLSLNDDNGNKGVVSNCSFPSALDGGKNLVSTGLIWTGNLHTGGISNNQPS